MPGGWVLGGVGARWGDCSSAIRGRNSHLAVNTHGKPSARRTQASIHAASVIKEARPGARPRRRSALTGALGGGQEPPARPPCAGDGRGFAVGEARLAACLAWPADAADARHARCGRGAAWKRAGAVVRAGDTSRLRHTHYEGVGRAGTFAPTSCATERTSLSKLSDTAHARCKSISRVWCSWPVAGV